MKILYHHRIRSKDGQYVHIAELIQALRKLGHVVILVEPPALKQSKFGDDAGVIAVLKRYCPGFVYELMELAYSFVVYWRLRKAVRAHQPDCLYERYNLFQPAGVWLKRRFNLPMLLEVNAPVFEERAKYDGIALPWLARWSERYTWRGADYVLPVTGVLAKRVETAGVDREKIVVIHNGINPDDFGGEFDSGQAKRRLGLEGKLVLGFTGFVRDWHGLDKVIDLIASADSGWHLLIVGDGPARDALEKQAMTLNVTNRLTITGIVGREHVAAHVAAFDVALQPAVVDYASPLKLFEYMALGRPVVAPAQPNIMEILTDGEDALLFDPHDPLALGRAVERMCRDAGLRQRIGDAARRTIQSRRLTWADNAVRVAELFAGLTGKREFPR
ncbi:MAG TPA: glycosyltransferase family 4 protein [Burkholderiales bacterium]|nr:glycosyltransferase family 4 protein [Burkholderiales bacterium]